MEITFQMNFVIRMLSAACRGFNVSKKDNGWCGERLKMRQQNNSQRQCPQYPYRYRPRRQMSGYLFNLHPSNRESGFFFFSQPLTARVLLSTATQPCIKVRHCTSNEEKMFTSTVTSGESRHQIIKKT
jgi:hypothetical protein